MMYLEYCRTCAITQAQKDALEARKFTENMMLEEPVIIEEQNNTIDQEEMIKQIISKQDITEQV